MITDESFIVQGRVHKILDEGKFEYRGKETKTRVFVIKRDVPNQTEMAFTLYGMAIDKLFDIRPGDFVEVKFELYSTPSGGRYLNNTKCTGLSKLK
jgi:hypothetical protein